MPESPQRPYIVTGLSGFNQLGYPKLPQSLLFFNANDIAAQGFEVVLIFQYEILLAIAGGTEMMVNALESYVRLK